MVFDWRLRSASQTNEWTFRLRMMVRYQHFGRADYFDVEVYFLPCIFKTLIRQKYLSMAAKVELCRKFYKYDAFSLDCRGLFLCIYFGAATAENFQI